MPLKWRQGVNPYVFNYFGILQLGPTTPPRQIVAQAKNLAQLLVAGQTLELGGEKLDEHAISDASSKLRDPRPHAEELLLVHPQSEGGKSRLKKTCSELQKLAVIPAERPTPELHDPLAALWFVPVPSPKASEIPPWVDFDFVTPGDEDDRQLDIVFDE